MIFLKLKEKKSLITDKTYGYEMPEDASVDIDDINDFRLASRLLKKSSRKSE